MAEIQDGKSYADVLAHDDHTDESHGPESGKSYADVLASDDHMDDAPAIKILDMRAESSDLDDQDTNVDDSSEKERSIEADDSELEDGGVIRDKPDTEDHGDHGENSDLDFDSHHANDIEQAEDELEDHGIVVRAIDEVPITRSRVPFMQPNDRQRISHTGTARANIAPSNESPNGTTADDWAERNKHRTVLQQHCLFFDSDDDGVIWPLDTYRAFYKLGYGVLLSILSVFIIHSNFSYPTVQGFLPDPLFRIYIKNIHKDKHGSDSGTYDTEGRFIPQKFEDMFSKYAQGRDYLTIWDIAALMKGQRVILDPVGWGAQFFEWLATYIMLWPKDGRMMKEDIRGIYDGSLFFTIAAKRGYKEKPVQKLESKTF